MINLYSYVVAHDTGFAPNPSGNYCTLACCKPDIRKAANVDDWVIGTGSKKESDKIIYAMKVTEKISFVRYSEDEEFKDRIDNIYYLNEKKDWEQKPNKYHKETYKNRDLSGIYVLISTHFYYFEKKGELIPSEFRDETNKSKNILKKGPNCKCKFNEEFVKNFLKWLEDNFEKCLHGKPHDFNHIDRKVLI